MVNSLIIMNFMCLCWQWRNVWHISGDSKPVTRNGQPDGQFMSSHLGWCG